MGMIVLLLVTQHIENANKFSAISQDNPYSESKPKMDFSVWEQGTTGNSEITSQELLNSLKSVLESDPHKTELTSSDIQSATAIKDPNTDGYKVTVTFTPAGKVKLLDITQRNLGKSIAVVVNGRIVNVTRVYSPIPGGTVEIVGKFTEDELNQLPKSQSTTVTTDPQRF